MGDLSSSLCKRLPEAMTILINIRRHSGSGFVDATWIQHSQHSQRADAIVHVIRCFDDEDVGGSG